MNNLNFRLFYNNKGEYREQRKVRKNYTKSKSWAGHLKKWCKTGNKVGGAAKHWKPGLPERSEGLGEYGK